MKKIATPIILTALFVMSLTSCENKKKLLARTWKIEDVKISKDVPEEQKAFFESMLAQMKQYLRLTYKLDGTYDAKFMGRSSAGKWVLSKDEKEMTATDESGRALKYKIITLTKDRFEYITSDSAQPVTFILVPGDSLPNTPPAPESPIQPEQPSASADTSAPNGKN